MADAAQLRKLVAYNQWANEKIVKAIEGMTAEDLARPVDAYFGSLAKNLQHILGATRVWLARWKGEPPISLGEPVTVPWPDAFAAVHAEFRAFVDPMTDADADRVVQYKDSRGNPYALPLGQLVTQVVNHGTHHRGELAAMLAILQEPHPEDDLLLYFMERQTAPA